MSLPTYVVELSFGSSGYVDVSSYVQTVSIGRGISRALEDYSAGSCSITFVNNNRVFDPLNQSSPLWYSTYTIVQPGGKLRVKANGITRFTGFIDNWEFAFDDAGLNGVATVVALDEIQRVSKAVFTGGTAGAVQATSDRMNTIFNYNGFGASEYSGIQAGQTLLGFDTYTAGDSVLNYLQQVARSEPGDFYSNASAVMQFKDRSFTDYVWSNTMRSNYVAYPSTAIYPSNPNDTGTWDVLGAKSNAFASNFGGTVYYGGTVVDPVPADSFVGFAYSDFNVSRYETVGTALAFSTYLRGVSGTYSGVFTLQDTSGNDVASTALTATSTGTASWVRISGYLTSVTPIGGMIFQVGVTGGTAFTVLGDGFLVEQGTALLDYFDGGWIPATDSATLRNRVAWAGTAYASQSGYLSASASTATTSTVLTFADQNSQGTAYGNGTAIPFTDLSVVYGSENLYNKVQVMGVNATAVAEDTEGQTTYGVRGYVQTDNLTTSTTRPAIIASSLLAEWRLPEYRAQQITVALHSLTDTQQNLLLALELRDVVRVCFQPSATGSVIDKFYQVLGLDSNTDVERDEIVLRLASLDNLPIRLDSLVLGVLDVDTLG